jgi:WhiB family redox-sensing transcriptional regulator
MLGRNIQIIDSWTDQASCKGKTELFFEAPHEKPSERRRREAKAGKICAECPVIYQCRSYAREHGEYGFWGGESDDVRWELGYLKNSSIARRQKARERKIKQRVALKEAETKNAIDSSVSSNN